MPKGVIIPQRLAAQFCRMNRIAVCFSCPVEERTNQPSGRKVNKAVSLVRSIDPNMVIPPAPYTRPGQWKRCVPSVGKERKRYADPAKHPPLPAHKTGKQAS